MRFATLLSVWLSSVAITAQIYTIDPTFNPYDDGTHGNGGVVMCSAALPSGQLLVGGSFRYYNGFPNSGVARINPDGTVDHGFEARLMGGSPYSPSVQVLQVVVQGDGRILALGQFSQVDGIPRPGLARLLPDGSLDAGFDPGAGAEGANVFVHAIAVQPDGKVLVAGSFTTFNGVARQSLVRLNADGSVDTEFDTGTGFGYPSPGSSVGSVRAVAVMDDGRVLAGGGFYSVNGVPHQKLAMLHADGSLDTTFAGASSSLPTVRHILVLPDGRVMVAGDFYSYFNLGPRAIARLLPDGTPDPTFTSTGASMMPGASESPYVSYMSLLPGNRLLVSGGFEQMNGQPCANVAILLDDGSPDPSFVADLGTYRGGAVGVFPDGQVLIGSHSHDDWPSRRFPAALRSNGDLEAEFNSGSGPSSACTASALLPDGRIIVVGHMERYNGEPVQQIMRLHPDGALDTTFNSEPVSYSGSGPIAGIHKVLPLPDGRLLIQGSFDQVGSTPRPRLARLFADGGLDHSFVPWSGALGPVPFVHHVQLLADGMLLVTAQTEVAPNQAQWKLYRLFPDGAEDPGFDTGTGGNQYITPPSVQGDGRVVISGHFTTFNGVPRNHIARLMPDGSHDPSFDPGTGPNQGGISATVMADGGIIVTGSFYEYNGVPTGRFIRLHPDGSLDQAFCPGNGPGAHADVIPLPDGGAFLTGVSDYSSYPDIGYEPVNGMIRIHPDGTLDPTFAMPGDCDAWGASPLFQPDGKIILSGTFTRYGGAPRHYLVRLQPDMATAVPTVAEVEGLSMHPNPTAGPSRVELACEGPCTVTVLDAIGRVVSQAQGAWEAPYRQVDLSAEPRGVYVVRVRTGQGTRIGRLVKQ